MMLSEWFGCMRRWWQRRRAGSKSSIKSAALRFERLETRETPATYIYFMPGYSSPVGNNGMTILADQIADDQVLNAHTTVIDWEWNHGLINLPLTPAVQTEIAQTRIRDDLRNHNVTAADKVIYVGHSYGGFLAYSMASKVPLLDRPVDALVLVDPIDWRYAHRWWPTFNQSRIQNPLPDGLGGSDVLNFVQRNWWQGWWRPPLQGFSVTGAYNDMVLAKGADDRWWTADDTNHSLIDSDIGRNGKSLGIYDTIRSFLYEQAEGLPTPIHATQAQPAPIAMWDTIRTQFPFVTTSEIYKADPAPDTFPEMYHSQGRGLAFTLAPSTRGVVMDALPADPAPQQFSLGGTVLGWGEAALGNALFRTIPTYASELGVDRIQWNGRIWSDDYATELRYVGAYPRDMFFIGFSLTGSQQVDPGAYARFNQALRTAWSEEVQLHAGWPLLAMRAVVPYNPWVMQQRIMPESDLNDPSRLGRFVIEVSLGDGQTKDRTRFNFEMFPARDRAQADQQFYAGRKLSWLPYWLTTPNWRWRGFVLRSNPGH